MYGVTITGGLKIILNVFIIRSFLKLGKRITAIRTTVPSWKALKNVLHWNPIEINRQNRRTI